jgi:hypothetical protein
VVALDFKPFYAALAERLRLDLGSGLAELSRQNRSAKSFRTSDGAWAQPALVVLEDTLGSIVGEPSRPASVWQLGAILVLHSRVSADDQAPGEAVLDLVGKIADALRWREGEPQSDGANYWTTLGGAVLRAWLEGDVLVGDDVDGDAAQLSTVFHVRMLARPLI